MKSLDRLRKGYFADKEGGRNEAKKLAHDIEREIKDKYVDRKYFQCSMLREIEKCGSLNAFLDEYYFTRPKVNNKPLHEGDKFLYTGSRNPGIYKVKDISWIVSAEDHKGFVREIPWYEQHYFMVAFGDLQKEIDKDLKLPPKEYCKKHQLSYADEREANIQKTRSLLVRQRQVDELKYRYGF